MADITEKDLDPNGWLGYTAERRKTGIFYSDWFIKYRDPDGVVRNKPLSRMEYNELVQIDDVDERIIRFKKMRE